VVVGAVYRELGDHLVSNYIKSFFEGGGSGAGLRSQLKNFLQKALNKGDFLADTIDIPQKGRFDIGARVSRSGGKITLNDVMFFPEGEQTRPIGTGSVRALIDQLSWAAKDMGFDTLEVFSKRVTGAYPGHNWNFVIDLTTLK